MGTETAQDDRQVAIIAPSGPRAPDIRLWIDGRFVGSFGSSPVRAFSVKPGVHRLQARRRILRSEVFELDLSAIDHATVYCLLRRWDGSQYRPYRIALVLFAMLSPAFGLVIMPTVLMAGGVLSIALAELRLALTPGTYLLLLSASDALEWSPTAPTGVLKRPQFTIARIMVAVVLLALALWLGVMEHRARQIEQHRRALSANAWRVPYHERIAAYYAECQADWMKYDRALKAQEEAYSRTIEILFDLIPLKPDDASLQPQLQEAHAAREQIKRDRQAAARLVLYYGGLKDKYEHAKGDPALPIRVDPPMPPLPSRPPRDFVKRAVPPS
jgi:tetratricopeptide (TPR) repeat protein